jgi:hypothetical protein
MPESPVPPSPSRPGDRHVRRWVALAATASGLVALATAGLAGTAGTAAAEGDHTIVLADGEGTRTLVLDGPTPAPTGSPGPAAAKGTNGAAPQMRLQLAYKRTGPHLALTVNLTGWVYEPLDATGKPMSFPTPATAAIGLGQDLAWGDGTGSAAEPDKGTCGAPAKLHEVKDSFTLEHTYKAAGTYNVVYTFRACGLTDRKITATLPITVSPATPAPAAPAEAEPEQATPASPPPAG